MNIILNNLKFLVHSPSLYQLLNLDTDEVCVTVSFEQLGWFITYSDLVSGHTMTRAFKSRDEAIELLASRRAA